MKMTVEQVRKDLKEIQYYYSRKNTIDSALVSIENKKILELLEKYNKVIRMANMKFYNMYIGIYVNNKTIQGYAFSDNVSYGYAKNLHHNLIQFFAQNL